MHIFTSMYTLVIVVPLLLRTVQEIQSMMICDRIVPEHASVGVELHCQGRRAVVLCYFWCHQVLRFHELFGHRREIMADKFLDKFLDKLYAAKLNDGMPARLEN